MYFQIIKNNFSFILTFHLKFVYKISIDLGNIHGKHVYVQKSQSSTLNENDISNNNQQNPSKQTKNQKHQEKLKALVLEVAKAEKEAREQKEQNKQILQLFKQKLLMDQQQQQKQLQIVYKIDNKQQKSNKIKQPHHKNKSKQQYKNQLNRNDSKKSQIIQTVKLIKPQKQIDQQIEQNIQQNIQQEHQVNQQIFQKLDKISNATDELKQIQQQNMNDQQISIKELAQKIQQQVELNKKLEKEQNAKNQEQILLQDEKKHIQAYHKLMKTGDASYTHKSLGASNNSSFSSSGLYSDQKQIKHQQHEQQNSYLIKTTIEQTINQLLPQITQSKIESQLQEIQKLLYQKMQYEQQLQQNEQAQSSQIDQQMQLNKIVNIVKEQVMQDLQQSNLMSHTISNNQQPQITYVTDQEPIFDLQDNEEKSQNEASRPQAREGLRQQITSNLDKPSVDLANTNCDNVVELSPQDITKEKEDATLIQQQIDEQNKLQKELEKQQQDLYQQQQDLSNQQQQLIIQQQEISKQQEELDKQKQDYELQKQQLNNQRQQLDLQIQQQQETQKQIEQQIKQQQVLEQQNKKQFEYLTQLQDTLIQQQHQLDLTLDIPFYNQNIQYNNFHLPKLEQQIYEQNIQPIKQLDIQFNQQQDEYIEEVISLQSNTQDQTQLKENDLIQQQEQNKVQVDQQQKQTQENIQQNNQKDEQINKQEIKIETKQQEQQQDKQQINKEQEKQIQQTISQKDEKEETHFDLSTKTNLDLEQKYNSSLFTQYQKAQMGYETDFYVQSHISSKEEFQHIVSVLSKLFYHFNEDIELFDKEFPQISKISNLVLIIDLILYYLQSQNVIIQTQDKTKQIQKYQDIQTLNDTLDLNNLQINISEQQFNNLCNQCYDLYINKQPSIQSTTYHILSSLNQKEQQQVDYSDKLLLQLLQEAYNEQKLNTIQNQ